MFYDIYISLCKRDGKKPSPVAVELGLRTSNVAQWKKGSTPRPEVLKKISNYFNVPISYLLGATTDPDDRSKTHWAELIDFDKDKEKEKPTPVSESGLDAKVKELLNIAETLSPENQAKLIELAQFYAEAQQRQKEDS